MSLNPRWYPWAWVVAAAILTLTRSEELGISMDPALFSSVARTMAQGGSFWSPSASEYLFPKYYEHPYLAIWLQALIFKLFGASDYTAKWLGLGFGCATFYYLFRIAENLVDESFAHLYCFTCLLSAYFVGRFPTFYLEIPLTFFLFAAFYHFMQAIVTDNLKDTLLTGLLLSAAILTKGLAVLPMVALILAYAVYERKMEVWRSWALYLSFGTMALSLAIVLLLQNYYGSFSFLQLYLARHSFGVKAHGAGVNLISWTFLVKFFQTHPVHLVLGILSPLLFFVRPELSSQVRSAFLVGLVGTLLFLSANGAIGYTHLHYFYTLYPLSNLLTAIALYPLALRFSQLRWWRIGIGCALFYQLVWHVLPIPMRRKSDPDLYLYKGLMSSLHHSGVKHLDAYGISEDDWGFRELSFWYWSVDSRMVKNFSELSSETVITCQQCREKFEIEKAGYQFCSGGKTYRFYVKPRLLSHCQNLLLEPGLIR